MTFETKFVSYEIFSRDGIWDGILDNIWDDYNKNGRKNNHFREQ